MDGEPPEEADFSKLSIEDCIAHKNWRARVSAYDRLTAQFRLSPAEDAPCFRPYLRDPDLLKRAVTDSNVAAQEKGVECVCAFVEFAGKSAVASRDAVVTGLVDKCLGSTRASIKTKAIELCELYTEVEGTGSNIVPVILEGLKAKQPKVVAASVMALRELVRQFGVKIVPPQPILKALPTIFLHADKSVRAEGTTLAQTCYRYIGPALDAFLAPLKPVQIKELKESFAEADSQGIGHGTAQQQRFTRDQQREKAIQETQSTLDGQSAAPSGPPELPDEPQVDVHDLVDPSDVKIPADFYDKLASFKWKERKEEALDPLLKVLQVPKIADSDFGELVRALAGRMTDANIACVTAAANCLEALALGLRQLFERYRSMVVVPVLERLKEKKQSVADALGKCLDAVAASAHLSDLVEDIATYAKHKNPQIKGETLKWLVRCLRGTRDKPTPADVKGLMAALLPALEDGSEPVRSAAQESVGTLMKIVGERAMAPHLAALDDLRKAKIQEFYDKAEVKAKAALGPAPSKAPPAPAPAKAAPQKRAPPVKADSPPPVKMPAKALAPSKVAPPAVKKAAPPTAAPSAKAPTKPGTVAEPIKLRFTAEEAEGMFASVLPTELLASLADSNWKSRLAAMDSLLELAQSDTALEAELIVRCVSKKPGWKESNFQVYGRMFQIFQALVEHNPTWSKGCSSLAIGPATDKLGDIKIKKPASDLLTAIAEHHSLQFVLSSAYEPLTAQKAPKAQADSLLWLDTALQDFGIQGVSVRDLIEFLKSTLKSTNALVRTNATKALVTVKLFVGSDIKNFLQDLNPALLTTIDGEFARVDGQQAPEPTRFSQDLQAKSTSAASGGSKASAANDPMDELFPRVDLEKLLPHSTTAACNDSNWKIRKEALEAVQGVLETHKRLKPSIGESDRLLASLSPIFSGDLSSVLKLRASDSNKVVQNLAFDVIKRLAAGMERPFERYCKTIMPPVLLVLGDQKPATRQQVLAVMTAVADSCGLDVLVGLVASALENNNPSLRKEALTWLTERDTVSNVDLAPIIGPLLSCLEDRNAEVRKAAVQLLPLVISSAGYAAVVDQTSPLKPASRALILPLLEAARPDGGGRAVPLLAQKAVVSSTAPGAAGKASRKSLAPAISAAISGGPPSPPASTRATAAPPPAGQSRAQRQIPSHQKPRSSVTEADAVATRTQEAPLKTADQRYKAQRASKEQGPLRWHVDGNARPEQIEFLHQQMMPHFSSAIMELLFSTDHHSDRDYLTALTILDTCLLEQPSEVAYDASWHDFKPRWIANLDLLFKYLTVRLSDSATTIVFKCLDFADHLMAVLSAESYFLSDYEANCCMPALVAKLGDQKEVLRARVRSLVKFIPTIYPASKLFAVILENGAVSKNARTRAESLEELTFLVQRHGASVYSMPKILPLLGTHIGDKDAASRSAALQLIGAIYTLEGDAVYAFLKGLSVKDQGLLDERLKRTSTTAPSAALPSTPIAKSSKVPLTNGNGIDRTPDAAPAPVRAPAPSAVVKVEDERLLGIGSANEALSVEALKAIQKDIANRPASLMITADALIHAIVEQMQRAFSDLRPSTEASTLRLCKHLMQTLSAYFDEAHLSKATSQEALVELLAELARRLLETADCAGSEAIGSLSKVLNMVLIRIFHNADKNACFGALLVILENVTNDLRHLQGAELDMRAKYAELVMKCLWKISKTAKDGLQEGSLDLSRLLQDIDRFLTSISPAEWRRRASDHIPLGDMPLRTCKTILQQIVSLYGERVFDELDRMALGDGSFVEAYLRRLLGNATGPSAQRSAHELRRVDSTMSTRSVLSEAASAVSAPTSDIAPPDDRELNQQLKEIFDAVGQPDKSKQGILALYEFRQKYPEAEARIQSWIDATGRHFKSYLERAMSNIDADRTGRAIPPKTSSPAAATLPRSSAPPDRSSSTSSVGNGNQERLQNLQNLFGFSGAP